MSSLRVPHMAGAQHRIASRQYNVVSEDLFLEAGQQSRLKILQATGLQYPPLQARKNSSTNTSETFVTNGDSGGRRAFCNTILASGTQDRENDVDISPEIEDSEQLHNGMKSLSDFSAFHIPKDHSFSRLLVTRCVFDTLCNKLNVFEAIRDTIMYMGLRERDIEVAPVRMRWQSLCQQDLPEELDGWECSYCLRYIEENHRPRGRPWSLRQFAVYNKTDMAAERSTWIFVSPPEDVLADFKDAASSTDASICETTIRLHLDMLGTALAYWRSYAVYLSEEVDKHNEIINFADPMGTCTVDLAAKGTRLKIKHLDDDITDAMISIQANQAQSKCLLRMWQCCRIDVGTIDQAECIVNVITERSDDMEALSCRLSSLREKSRTCMQIVSSFSELTNGRSLRTLAEQAQVESERTIALAVEARKDTAAVKALTIIALVFLPTTVVLNFFSTTLVNSSHGGFVLVDQWWLFLAIGGPLTIATLLGWYLWIHGRLGGWAKQKWSNSKSQFGKESTRSEMV